jgi:ATP-dependent Clp protease ATP-binding subunit ClpB
VTLTVDDKAKLWLADKGFDPVYGARPLKRAIQTYLQNHLAEMILQGEIPDGSSVAVSEKSSKLDFKVMKSAGNADAKSAA